MKPSSGPVWPHSLRPWSWPGAQCFSRGVLWYFGWNNSLLCRIFNIPDPWALHSTVIKMPPYISKCPKRGSYFSLLNSWSGLRCLQLGTMIITDLGKVMCNFCFGFSSRAKYRVELKRFQNSHHYVKDKYEFIHGYNVLIFCVALNCTFSYRKHL